MKRSYFFHLGIYLVLLLCCTPLAPAISQEAIIQQVTPVTGDGTLRRIRVPILMYHYVSQLPEDADDIRINLTVEPEMFRAQMQHLAENDYHTISLYELHAALMQGAPLPYNPVILTFDDGYVDHYNTVFPILRDYGFTATFFVITGLADAGNINYLSWAQIREMANAGMSMESHTKTHLNLEAREYDFLVYEIVGSMESLAAITGRETHMFCYPAGRYDDATLNMLQTTTVWRAVTTQPGTFQTTDNALEMPRVRVSNSIDLTTFAHLLRAG